MLHPRTLTIVGLLLAGAATRILPHWPNFTAMGAVCLFGGACLRPRWAALLVPLAALAISDLYLAAFVYGLSSLRSVPVSYGLFALITGLGMLLGRRITGGRVLLSAVGASTLFFFGSNFAVWWLGHRYPHTPAGLWACYLAGLPFAWNMLAADLVYSGLFFGAWAVLQRRVPALRDEASPARLATRTAAG